MIKNTKLAPLTRKSVKASRMSVNTDVFNLRNNAVSTYHNLRSCVTPRGSYFYY